LAIRVGSRICPGLAARSAFRGKQSHASAQPRKNHGGEQRMRRYLGIVTVALQDAGWLTRKRLLGCGSFCAFLTIGGLSLDLASLAITGINATAGKDLGRDFFTLWSAAMATAAGRPESAYVVGPDHPLDHAMPHPPPMLLLCRPLADFTYAQALLLWISLGFVLYIVVLCRLVDRRMAVFAAIGAPAAFVNIYLGQTGYYTAALLGSGLMLIHRRPLAAGLLLGCLSCKPQLGLLVPVALFAGGHWRVVCGAISSAIVLATVSTLVFGLDSWVWFSARLAVQRSFMESHAMAWAWMPSVFAAVRLAGAGSSTAYLAQFLSALCAAAAIATLWRRPCSLAIKSAGLVIAAFLATPYAWVYDTIVLIFAAAWLGNEGAKTGFLPWEKITVIVLLTLAALSLLPAKLIHLQIGPVLLWLALAVVLRRGFSADRISRQAPARIEAARSFA
jgi:arabinofuranan 3-O-arabinosyltransferase